MVALLMHSTTLSNNKVGKQMQSPSFTENGKNMVDPYFTNNTLEKHNESDGDDRSYNTNKSRKRVEDHQLKCSTSNHKQSFITTSPQRAIRRRPLFHGRQNSKDGPRLSIPAPLSFYLHGAAGQDITPRSMSYLQRKVRARVLSITFFSLIAKHNEQFN